MISKHLVRAIMLLLTVNACTEKYVAKTAYPSTGYLVIDGSIDPAGTNTHFRLSRTVPLDSVAFRAETNATVVVESEDNQTYTLAENGNGNFSLPGVPMNNAVRHRLRITTADGRAYLSDFVETRITPPIDSVSWEVKENGVQISVSSHDPVANTLYYQWRFEETWKYHARYFSDLVWQNNELELRPADQDYYTCWKSDTSSDILIGSTAKLSADVVADQPLTLVPFSETFNKLSMKYSINVREYALTKGEYEWFEKIKKNNESLGSIFDAQPSDITGNFHCLSDPTEPVIGYLGCRTETVQRIFINRGQLPPVHLSDGYEYCQTDTVQPPDLEKKIRDAYSSGFGEIPIDYLYSGRRVVGVIGSSLDCIDCRRKGGSVLKPPFWQD